MKNMCIFVISNFEDYKCKIMINRINLILRAKNITAKQFAEEIGIQPSGMSHILSGRNNPSLDFVSKVIRRYPEIDANWLLMGKGEMYGAVESGKWQPESERVPLAAPTLFSDFQQPPAPTLTPAPAPAPTPAPDLTTLSTPDPEPEPLVQDLPKEEPAPISDDGRRLVKILFFYDDHTFEEYRPE